MLNRDGELVPNEQLLAQNGIKMLEHHRIKQRPPATGRQVDAMTVDGGNNLFHPCRGRTQHGFCHCES